MKKLIIAIVMFINMTAKTQVTNFPGVIDKTDYYTLEDCSFTLTPFGVIGEIYITVTGIDSGEGKVWGSWEYNSEGNKEEFSSFTFKKNVKTKISFSISGANPNTYYHYFAIKTSFGGCGIGLKGNLFSTPLNTPAIRELVVKNAIDTNTSYFYSISSTTESSNIDEIISYEIKDSGGKVLEKIKDTIPGTVEKVIRTKIIPIDFVKYPNATSLVTQSQTSSKQTLKLKNTTSSVVSPSITIEVMTDETTIEIINLSGQSLGFTTWGNEKYISRDVLIKTETMKPKRKSVVVF